MTSGLLLDGVLRDVPGLRIVPPAALGGPAWNRLDPGDCTARGAPPGIVELHTTGGLWPQAVIPGAGPAGHAQQILEMWRGDPQHSGASIVVDFDGVIYCAADLVRIAAYHSMALNQRSVGIEMCTRPDGGIYQATLTATAGLVAALTYSGHGEVSGLLPIQFAMPRGPYKNAPLRRLELAGVQTDGKSLNAVIGHRDQTAQRGYGDPGNAIWVELAALGCEGMDLDGYEDLLLGRDRQTALNRRDARAGETRSPLTVDGVVGPATIARARAQGFARMLDVH